jgi:hypothetical protein
MRAKSTKYAVATRRPKSIAVPPSPYGFEETIKRLLRAPPTKKKSRRKPK